MQKLLLYFNALLIVSPIARCARTFGTFEGGIFVSDTCKSAVKSQNGGGRSMQASY